LSYRPRSSLPVEVLTWLVSRLAHLLPPRPPGQGGTPPLSLEARLDAVGAVILDGLSYRRAGRMVGISKTEVGDSLDLLLGALAKLGVGQPDGTFVTSLADLRHQLAEMAATGEAAVLDGLATRVQRPGPGPTRRCSTTPSATPTPPRAWRCPPSTATCCGAMVAGRAAATSTSCWRCRGSARCWTPPRWSPWSTGGLGGWPRPGRTGTRPIGDRRTIDQRTDAERAHNRAQAELRALVEQSIGHLANAWSLRRWRGLLFRVRDVFRAAAALISLGRWFHRIPI
jgi:hypothetical protein